MQVQIKRRIEEGRRKESTPQSSHIISVVLFLYGLPVPAADELSDICSSRVWRAAAAKKKNLFFFFAYCAGKCTVDPSIHCS